MTSPTFSRDSGHSHSRNGGLESWANRSWSSLVPDGDGRAVVQSFEDLVDGKFLSI